MGFTKLRVSDSLTPYQCCFYPLCSLLTLWLPLHASERRNLGNPTRVNGAHGATLTAWGCSGVQYQWCFGDAQLHHGRCRLTGGRLRCARAIPPPLQPFAPARLCFCNPPNSHPRSVLFYLFCGCCEATKKFCVVLLHNPFDYKYIYTQ